MGKQNLCKGMLIGAIVGGAATLLDHDTRQYVKTKSQSARVACRSYAVQPSLAIHHLRQNYDDVISRLSSGAEDALGALNKLEELLDKVSELDNQVDQEVKKIDEQQNVS
ncbi:YtxH domain-containing protein [Thalassobacillus sp. CUG 92003]|uniref:YtxH domain-containing protein n=1 Tax=Thalassobacillus sp. CUG 92003 TaxID=2736641 RepID=UPI0015E71D4B|nr:YtxH domain-containing protein [Thalassobacillus sp. CUG 92003]